MFGRTASLLFGALLFVACSSAGEPAAPSAPVVEEAGAPPDAGPPPPPDADAAPPDPTFISMAPDSKFEAETDVAVTPDGTLVAAWIASNPQSRTAYSRIGYALSADQGATWTKPAYAPLPDGQFASDPSLAVDAVGNVYLSWLGVEADPQGHIQRVHVNVSKAPKGTTSFGSSVEVPDPAGNAYHDHPWISITRAGTIVVVFSSFANEMASNGSAGIAATSQDGVTWTTTTMVNAAAGSFYNLFYPCPSASGGRLWVAFWAGDKKGLYVGMRYSDDEGATFSPDEIVASDPVGEQNGDFPTCAADGDSVWVGYGTTDDPGGAEEKTSPLDAIRLATSHDKGKTFTRVDLAAQSGVFTHPRLVRRADGTMDVLYWAGKADGDPAGSVRRVHFAGTTASPSNAVESPLTFILDRATPSWLGDYLGLAERNGVLYATYADNVRGASHVAFRRLGGN